MGQRHAPDVGIAVINDTPHKAGTKGDAESDWMFIDNVEKAERHRRDSDDPAVIQGWYFFHFREQDTAEDKLLNGDEDKNIDNIDWWPNDNAYPEITCQVGEIKHASTGRTKDAVPEKRVFQVVTSESQVPQAVFLPDSKSQPRCQENCRDMETIGKRYDAKPDKGYGEI